MCDSDNHQGFVVDTSVTRRSAAAAVTGLPTAAFAADVVEKDVMVPTPDGPRRRGAFLSWGFGFVAGRPDVAGYPGVAPRLP